MLYNWLKEIDFAPAIGVRTVCVVARTYMVLCEKIQQETGYY